MTEKSVEAFLSELSSGAPVPGGGGASALAGAAASALASMVANLTTGKKKYAEYQAEIDEILVKTSVLVKDFESLIEKDAEVFEPLAKAYSIPKDEPGRDEALEEALNTACSAPYEIVMKTKEACEIIVRLETIGSRLAISDVGVAATMLQTAAKGAAMNVYINTKLMKNRSRAEELNAETIKAVEEVDAKCAAVYEAVKDNLTGGDNK
ncbi:MAG: cyclodeaminase/cyclohydrolase family protein [Clostridiales bacterium]|nr:cyclodeaminase/cyclohydrolase family protein [Clostridiales bacterium]